MVLPILFSPVSNVVHQGMRGCMGSRPHPRLGAKDGGPLALKTSHPEDAFSTN